ncbi:hypothetical protein J6590_019744 [Homalodisca vitripennis]|nr:hypothetical protein J6590_019744 [Homalodisca vitripennis]
MKEDKTTKPAVFTRSRGNRKTREYFVVNLQEPPAASRRRRADCLLTCVSADVRVHARHLIISLSSTSSKYPAVIVSSAGGLVTRYAGTTGKARRGGSNHETLLTE